MLKTFKYWIYGLTLTYSFLFFSIYAILGLEFGGSENNLNYIFGYATFSLLSCAFGLYSLLIQKFITKVSLWFFILPLIITLFYIFESPSNDFAFRTYLSFIVIVFPIILIGLDLAKTQSLERIYNSLVFVFVIVTIGALKMLPGLISTNIWKLEGVFGGGNTQSLSYTMSFVYMIGLVSIIDSTRVKKIWHLKSTLFLALIVLVLTTILAGGRGAFLVVLGSSIVFIFREYKKLRVLKLIPIFILIYLMYSIVTYYLDERFVEGIGRIFAYIASSGLNLEEGSSNRDVIYLKALDLFYENKVFGAGIFTQMKTIGGYSHNIFLDILGQGGIFFLIFFLILMVYFFRKLKRILEYDPKSNLILIFIIYSFTLLLFTNTYLNESFFWFSLAYVFNFSYRTQLIESEIDY